MTAVIEQGQLAGPLSTSVANLCRRLQPQVSAPTAAGFAEVLRRLGAPLQVAVAGRIKSGKSTLVNALIGRRVAPTDVGECTRLVTRFQYGTVDRVEVVLANGAKKVLSFAADGMIPAGLGIDLDTVSHLEVYLTNAVLRGMTVIDTPGLGSLDAASMGRTEGLLGGSGGSGGSGGTSTELDDTSRSAVAGAEAVLYVVTQ
ncbi:MAG: dynamin family protein, partial [Haloechinothrix sp.]